MPARLRLAFSLLALQVACRCGAVPYPFLLFLILTTLSGENLTRSSSVCPRGLVPPQLLEVAARADAELLRALWAGPF